MILSVLIIVLFLAFYSAYYYYSINMGDETIVVSEDKYHTSLGYQLNIKPDAGNNLIAFPVKEVVSGDTLNHRRWGVFCEDLKSDTIPSVKCQLRIRDELLFTDNLYVTRNPQSWGDTVVRSLIGRPGHRGVAARLFELNESGLSRFAEIPYPNDDKLLVIVSAEQPNLSLSDVLELTRHHSRTHDFTELTINHRMRFPMMKIRGSVTINDTLTTDIYLDDLEFELTVSAAQRDVSLLPSRRITGDAAEIETPWIFDGPFYFFIMDEGKALPRVMGYIGNAELLNR